MPDSADVIFIRGLCFDAIIGIYEQERTTPQRLRIDLELEVDTRSAARSGNIDDTVDYAALAREVQLLAQDARAYLVESLAEQIAAHTLAKNGVQSVAVQLTKPDALPDSTEVGLRICRQR